MKKKIKEEESLPEQWDRWMDSLTPSQVQALLGCEERTAYYYRSKAGRPKDWQIKIYLEHIVKGGGTDNRAARMLEARKLIESALDILSE